MKLTRRCLRRRRLGVGRVKKVLLLRRLGGVNGERLVWLPDQIRN
jgi:hypothetical protein